MNSGLRGNQAETSAFISRRRQILRLKRKQTNLLVKQSAAQIDFDDANSTSAISSTSLQIFIYLQIIEEK